MTRQEATTSSVVHFRTSQTRKSLYEQQANSDGSSTLSEWLRSLADQRVAERTLAQLTTAGER